MMKSIMLVFTVCIARLQGSVGHGDMVMELCLSTTILPTVQIRLSLSYEGIDEGCHCHTVCGCSPPFDQHEEGICFCDTCVDKGCEYLS